MSIRVQKVSYNGERIKIEYEQTNPHTLGIDSFTMEGSDKPSTNFLNALEALREHIASICEFSADYAASIKPRGVSVSWNRTDNEVVSGTVFAVRSVTQTHSPFNIHVPVVQFAKHLEEFPSLRAYLDDIEALLSEAKAYLDGDRAQIEMFDEEAEEEAEA